jgi:predicted lipoprotein with Yx(FWY)xxD motif
MRWNMGLPLLVAAGIALAACGGGGDDNDTSADTAPAAATEPANEFGETVSVKTASSDLGEILVGIDGMTLYGFTNDVDSKSTCNGACADAWPPVIVDEDWTVGPELDNAIFSTTTRDDGTIQLVAGKWPLYYFSGDAAPGDTNGQGSGDVWFVVGKDARLIDAPGSAPAAAAAPAPAEAQVRVAETELGLVLVDSDGHTLYGFTKDSSGTPTCVDACADAWPPLVIDGEPQVGDLDASTFSAVERPDGDTQLKAGKWPLYRFAGDEAEGDINGQGSGGIWFAVRPDGSLVK